ncbi:F-box/LRR-repeat protein 12 isoform X1 [Onychomys torridus]|uniref:F-box/LRR-repeat protein 12 isoform X1 n=2 Tax=Onychomys torridus TaxID=38674 RepID=UPI00167FA911|nr:F-box/LRR-repeat protein 12 isoform X1 [Onychomys torridus]
MLETAYWKRYFFLFVCFFVLFFLFDLQGTPCSRLQNLQSWWEWNPSLPKFNQFPPLLNDSFLADRTLSKGLSPLEEAGGRSVVVATRRPDALHDQTGLEFREIPLPLCPPVRRLKMRPKVMWHLLRRYMASRLHSLRLGGYLFSGSQAPQLSPALMRALGQKCPNLKRLCLHVADMSMVPITSLPSTLRTLELHSCEISMIWLQKEQDPTVLPLLECIVLDRVPAFRDEHLQGLTRFRALRSLVLGGTYRVTETGLDASLQELSYLQRLEVLGCTLSADSTLLAISRHLRDVRKIRLTVGGLSAQGLVFLEGMPALESLCFQGPLITPEMPTPVQLVSSCLTMPKLRVLEVQGLGWEGQEAEKVLCKGLPHCMVIVRACPKESMDWWM